MENKEKLIADIKKQLAHERYLKYKASTMRWRENNKEKYNNYMREYSKNYLTRKAEKIFQGQYEN